MTLTFTIPGAPRGKGRPRFARRGNFVRTYTDPATASYENLIALAAKAEHGDNPPLDGPLAMTLLFVLPRPKSAPKRVTLPASRPDLDNLVKAVLDGCNQAGVWSDDARVVEMFARKVYGDPCCHVLIEQAVEGVETTSTVTHGRVRGLFDPQETGMGVQPSAVGVER
jgi:Holliday junction resolvase RusA-like endonuclease